jgi:hypothetical protein
MRKQISFIAMNEFGQKARRCIDEREKRPTWDGTMTFHKIVCTSSDFKRQKPILVEMRDILSLFFLKSNGTGLASHSSHLDFGLSGGYNTPHQQAKIDLSAPSPPLAHLTRTGRTTQGCPVGLPSILFAHSGGIVSRGGSLSL